MKRIIALLLSLALLFVLASCKDNGTDENNNNGGGSNDIGNTIGGGGNGTCSGRVHRDDVQDFVCDDCGLNLEKEMWWDHNGNQHFPLEDL